MNNISSLLIILFAFYSSFSFCQEFNEEKSADYRIKSDSLLERRLYEHAETLLSLSFSLQPRELRTKEYQRKYKKQKNYLDSLIDCCLTDSKRCSYRVETALDFIDKGYRGTANTWFKLAENYSDNSEYFRINYKKLFSSKVPDTIWVNSNELDYNGFEIIRLDPEQDGFVKDHLSYDELSEQIIHLRRDTSLFSGVIIKKVESHRIHHSTSIGQFNIWHVKNGKVEYNIDHLVFNDPEKNGIKTSDPTGHEVMKYFDDDNYYYGVRKNNGDTVVRFYPNGDTLSKGFRMKGHQFNQYSVSYHPTGDTNFYSFNYKTDTNTLVTEQKTWDKDNNLIFTSSEVRGLDKNLISEESISFNKHGDTTAFSHRGELNKLHGIQYTPLYQLDNEIELKTPYILRVLFEMDSLQTILNRDIIFLDKRFRQISQSEFLELIEPQMQGTFWFEEYMFSLSESYEINGVTYNAVACTERYRLRKKKKKLKRKLNRLE